MTTTIEVKNLKKHFGPMKAVDGISFAVAGGEIFGLLGPNGAGKTTTLRVIATTLTPTAGTATVCGWDIIKNPEEVKKNIGVLTTDIGVYDRFSGRENLRYFGALYGMVGQTLEKRINDLAGMLDMANFLDRRAGNYSTGMKQKLAIARAVVHDPVVLILDEPTSGLDVLASQTVLKFMSQMKAAGKSVILSTHQMPDADKLSDRVGIIHEGRILALDTVEALKRKTQTSDLEDTFLALVKGAVQI